MDSVIITLQVMWNKYMYINNKKERKKKINVYLFLIQSNPTIIAIINIVTNIPMAAFPPLERPDFLLLEWCSGAAFVVDTVVLGVGDTVEELVGFIEDVADTDTIELLFVIVELNSETVEEGVTDMVGVATADVLDTVIILPVEGIFDSVGMEYIVDETNTVETVCDIVLTELDNVCVGEIVAECFEEFWEILAVADTTLEVGIEIELVFKLSVAFIFNVVVYITVDDDDIIEVGNGLVSLFEVFVNAPGGDDTAEDGSIVDVCVCDDFDAEFAADTAAMWTEIEKTNYYLERRVSVCNICYIKRKNKYNLFHCYVQSTGTFDGG